MLGELFPTAALWGKYHHLFYDPDEDTGGRRALVSFWVQPGYKPTRFDL